VEGLDERKRRRFYAERYILPGMLRELAPDAVFAPLGGSLLQAAVAGTAARPTGQAARPTRYVYRLASLAYLQEAERFSPLEQLFYGKTIPASCRSADRVLVDHSALADSAADRGLAGRRALTVVAPGYAPAGQAAAADRHDGQSHQADQRSILLLGGDDDVQLPKLWSGLTAHARLPRGWADATYVCLSRQAGSVSGPRLLAVEDAPAESYARFLSSASAALCLSASDSALPSLRHALACGLPVLAADTPALRAVAGDAALYVPPYELADTASALAVLLADDNLRTELGSKAQQLAGERTWQNAAQQIATLLKG
jgi:glycosyltransferase involved in cell wall biosynthesis